MQRYFAKGKKDDSIILYDTDLHHIKNVMRYKVGDTIEVVYEKIVYLCRITSLEPFLLETIKEYNNDSEMNIDLTIAISLVNEQKMDLILQKLTELGVSKIIPVKTERSIVKLDANKEIKKINRWQTICKEASEQSKRVKIPQVMPIVTIEELSKIKNEMKLICSLDEKSQLLSNYLRIDINEILFVIGPEGGFTILEEKKLLENGFLPVSLGKRIMRVETAAIYAASIINYIYEG
jgi:16S rRNA (uracil1498-N3)-methyltransferase